jgi:uncharacterized protein (UPF0332 family)
MRRKAEDSLRATEHLVRLGLHDSGASRLYYALYAAAVDWMKRAGRQPGEFTSGASKWRHATIVGNASLYRRSLQDVLLFRTAYSLRLRADYDSIQIAPEELQLCFGEAQRFLEELYTDE